MTTLRYGAYWTEGEVSALLQSIKTKEHLSKIASIHGRSLGAITSMLRKIASTFYFRDKLPVSQIQEITGLSDKTITMVLSEGPRSGKMEHIKRMKPIIPQTMEFPITCERLHHFGAEYEMRKKKEQVDFFVNKFTEEILEKAWRSQSMEHVAEPEKKKRRLVVHGKDLEMTICTVNRVWLSPEDCSNAIVEEMKKRFPDMVIVRDPLGTYILFDWN